VTARGDGGLARERLEHGLLLTALGGRNVITGILLVEGVGGRGRYRRPKVMALIAGAQVLTTVIVSRRAARRATWHDDRIGWIETSSTAAGLLAEAVAGPMFSQINERPMQNYGLAVSALAAMAFSRRSAVVASSIALGVASAAAAVLNRQRRGYPLPAVAVGGVNFAANSAPARIFVEELRRQALDLDVARKAALVQTERLAAEQERDHQRRVVHDSALQVIEVIAGDWQVDDELLLARIDFEIERLEQLVRDGTLPRAASLGDGLARLTEEFELQGLRVSLDLEEAAAQQVGPTAEALGDAAHEALANVRKHANVELVRISLCSAHDGIELAISDSGVGFDPMAPHSGFGLRESIERRMSDGGGTAEVDSAPGAGTTVRLWGPA
jgi:signal transduction histidine kinase